MRIRNSLMAVILCLFCFLVAFGAIDTAYGDEGSAYDTIGVHLQQPEDIPTVNQKPILQKLQDEISNYSKAEELDNQKITSNEVEFAALPTRIRGVSGYLKRISQNSIATTIDNLPVGLLSEWGVNVIRFNLSADTQPNFINGKSVAPADLLTNPLHYYSASLNALKNFLSQAEQTGMKVMVSLADSYGVASPTFFAGKCTGSAPQPVADIYREHVISFWREFMSLYKGNSSIVAVEVKNEPKFAYSESINNQCIWADVLIPKALNVIREADANIPVVIEPGSGGHVEGFNYLKYSEKNSGEFSFKKINDPNILYSFHMYAPYTFTHQCVSNNASLNSPCPGNKYPWDNGSYATANNPYSSIKNTIPERRWNKSELEAYMKPAIDFMNRNNVKRILVSEFGAVRWAPGAKEYYEDLISIFESKGWDWMYHSLFGFDGWNAANPETNIPSNYGGTGSASVTGFPVNFSENPRLQVVKDGWKLNLNTEKEIPVKQE